MKLTVRQKGLVYTELAEVINNLKYKAEQIEEDAAEDLEACRNEETGETNTDSWRYQSWTNKTHQVEAINILIKMFEDL